MKIRCLLLTGSVAILQYTSNSVRFVEAHRLLVTQDPVDASAPTGSYYIDQQGLLTTVEEEEQQKVKAQAEKIKKEKDDNLNKEKDDFKNQVDKFSKHLNKEDFIKAMEMKTNLIENENVSKEELDKIKINTKNLY